MAENMQDGKKFDEGKSRFSLFPINALKQVNNVLEFGAKKYGADNWKNVNNAETRYFDATMRHLMAWKEGEKNDTETGENHLAHAISNLMFMLWFDNENVRKEALEIPVVPMPTMSVFRVVRAKEEVPEEQDDIEECELCFGESVTTDKFLNMLKNESKKPKNGEGWKNFQKILAKEAEKIREEEGIKRFDNEQQRYAVLGLLIYFERAESKGNAVKLVKRNSGKYSYTIANTGKHYGILRPKDLHLYTLEADGYPCYAVSMNYIQGVTSGDAGIALDWLRKNDYLIHERNRYTQRLRIRDGNESIYSPYAVIKQEALYELL